MVFFASTLLHRQHPNFLPTTFRIQTPRLKARRRNTKRRRCCSDVGEIRAEILSSGQISFVVRKMTLTIDFIMVTSLTQFQELVTDNWIPCTLRGIHCVIFCKEPMTKTFESL